MLSERERSGTLVDRERENFRCVRDVGLYGTGIIFEEPNPTGSRQSDLIGLSRTAPDAPTLRGPAHHVMASYSIINCAKVSLVVVGFIVVFVV